MKFKPISYATYNSKEVVLRLIQDKRYKWMHLNGHGQLLISGINVHNRELFIVETPTSKRVTKLIDRDLLMKVFNLLG